VREINEIIIHCADTRPDWKSGKPVGAKVDEIRRWHVEENNFSDIGYHYCIDRDGVVATARPVSRIGAHVRGHNKGSIGVVLLGGYGGNENDSFNDNFSEEQDIALRKLIKGLRSKYKTISKVSGHNEYSSKACPCFNVSQWMFSKSKVKTLPPAQSRKKPTQSKTVRASAIQAASAVGGIVAAFQSLNGTAQIVAISGCVLVILTAMFILKERLKAWASGWH
tara:strand:- start:1640 stop:2308 length:669 start_codon:yes stop_codon:yes gene_type:complete